MSNLEDLERLQKLKESGTITEEFVIKKKKILNYENTVIEKNSNTIKEESKQEIAIGANSCEKCGNKIFKGDKFCVKCGTKIGRVKGLNSYNQQNKKSITIKFNHLVITSILLLIVIIFVVLLFRKEDNSNSNNMNRENSVISTVQNESINRDKTTISTNEKLSLDDVQMNIKFTDLNGMNKVTEKIMMCGWQYVKELYPNAKWNYCTIYSKDGYGRYNLTINFVKSSTSEEASAESIMVWVKDINSDKLGYYYNYLSASYTEWGKPLSDNIGD